MAEEGLLDQALPGMEPGTTPDAAGDEASPGSGSQETYFGKYKTKEEAAKGFDNLAASNMDLKEQLEDMKDQMAEMLAKQAPAPGSPPPQEAPQVPAALSSTFKERWNTGDYPGAISDLMKNEVGGMIKGEIQNALTHVSKRQDDMDEAAGKRATDAIIARFAADEKGHPGFEKLKPIIFQTVREQQRANKDWGKGMDTEKLVHMLYLDAREQNPDLVNQGAGARAAAVSAGGAGAGLPGGQEGVASGATWKYEPKKLPRKAWSELGLEWHPHQYKLSNEDMKNIRKTEQLARLEQALANERKRLMSGVA